MKFASVFLTFLVLFLCVEARAADKIQKISKSIVLESNGYYNGENIILMPEEGFTDPAFIIGSDTTITNRVTIENVTMVGFGETIVAKNCNTLCFTKMNFQRCEKPVSLQACWDTTIGPAFRSIQCGTVIEIKGHDDRYSNPTNLIDCRFESFSESAVVIEDAGNIVFSQCKFHGKIGSPPSKPSIVADSYNCVRFRDCLFMFNKQHFTNVNPEKLSIEGAITDNSNSITVGGKNIAKNTFVNQRGK